MIELKQAPGKSFSYKELKAAIEKNKPAALFLCQVCLDFIQYESNESCPLQPESLQQSQLLRMLEPMLSSAEQYHTWDSRSSMYASTFLTELLSADMRSTQP